MTHERLNGLE